MSGVEVHQVSRRALIFWAAGVFAYVIAIFHRQSLGVAGIAAADRFEVTATGLSALAMLQILVYAGLQIPVGMLVDRFGSKRMLISGALTIAAGESVFALAPGLLGAVAGRALVGGGDAMTFISVIRLVAIWFPPRRNPLFVQITAIVGQLGALISAVPLIYSLDRYGWTPTFLGMAATGLLSLVLVAAALRDARPERAAEPPRLRDAWAEPGTRLGMWTHGTTQCSGAAFALLWGYPYLVQGQGLAPATAGVLLSVATLLGMVVGPLLGHLAGRYPHRRSRLVIGVVAVTALGWTLVLAWPGRAPLWALVLLMAAIATNGPGSVIGFDYARTFNPAARIGAASGIVNGGGFAVSMTLIALIGVLLDLHGGDPAEGFRWALAVQYPIWALGTVQILRYRGRTRRRLAAAVPASQPG